MLTAIKHILCLSAIIALAHGVGVTGGEGNITLLTLSVFIGACYGIVLSLQLFYFQRIKDGSDYNQSSLLPSLEELRSKNRLTFKQFSRRGGATLTMILLILSLIPPLNPLFEPISIFAVLPDPVVTVTPPDAVFIGNNFNFDVSLDNNSPDESGFGPYIELIVPTNGADGAAGTDIQDGITINSATFGTTTLPLLTLTFADDGVNAAPIGCLDHPVARDSNNEPIEVCGTIGDTLVVVELPFGSYAPDQPNVPVTFNASLSDLSDLDQTLNIETRGGFSLGADELRNPSTDPSIFASTYTDIPVNPQVLVLTKENDAPEGETVTGPNFIHSYTITANLAVGQTVNNLVFTDNIPNDIVYQGVSSLPAGCVVSNEPVQTVPTNNAVLEVTCPSISASAPVSVVYDFYGADIDADGVDVISHTTGDEVVTTNSVSATGEWVPIDTRDLPGAVLNAGPVTSDVTLKSVSVQKAVSLANDIGGAGFTPGDTVEYVMSHEISDYFGFEGLEIVDFLSDGQRYDSTFIPTITFNLPEGSSSQSFDAANFDVFDHFSGSSNPSAPITGETRFVFRVSDEAVTQGLVDAFRGGCVPLTGTGALPNPDCSASNSGPTTFTITYRAVIQDEFSDNFPSGEPNVDISDRMFNNATVTGDILLNTDPSQTTGESEDDGTSVGYTIVDGTFSKAVYGVNGVEGLPVELYPGDEVTYRIQYSLPSTDFEELMITDYLPLPVYEAAEISPTFNSTVGGFPPAGEVRFGPDDTHFAITNQTPVIGIDSNSNNVTFDFGSFNDMANQASLIDILFTVTINDKAMADNLPLTNQATVDHGSTNNVDVFSQDIQQVSLRQPELLVSKGIVNTDNSDEIFEPTQVAPAGVTFDAAGTSTACGHFAGTISSDALNNDPIESSVSEIDGGDTLRYAVVVQNIGGSEAFDVSLRDVLPAGATPSNLCVTDGAGTIIPFTPIDNTDTNPFFEDGIVLDDTANGSLALLENDTTNNATTGLNLAVITYDVTLPTMLDTDLLFTNGVELLGLANIEAGENIAPELMVSVDALSSDPVVTKDRLTTSEPVTPNDEAAPGALVTYEVDIEIPEGVTPNLVLTDTLSAGHVLVGIDTITPSDPVALNASIGFSNFTIAPDGSSYTFDFGDITNTDTDNTVTEFITISYTAVVLDTTVRDDALNNTAQITWGVEGAEDVTTDDVIVIEPELLLSKSISPSSSGDAGDLYTVTISASHSPDSNADAHDVSISDSLPTFMNFNGSLTDLGDGTPTLQENTGTVSASAATIALGESLSFSFEVILDPGVVPNTDIINNAGLVYSSIPGDINSPQSTFNPDSEEKDYNGTASDQITSSNAQIVKTIVDTDINNLDYTTPTPLEGTTGNNVVVGEQIQYQIVVTVPEGTTPDAALNDVMDNGLVLIGVDSITASTGIETDGSTDFSSIPLAVTNNGRNLLFDFGEITNTDTDNNTAETITILYTVQARNNGANNEGTNRNNNASWSWAGNPTGVSDNAPNVTIREPLLEVTKGSDVNSGQRGTTVNYTIEIENTSTVPAYDVEITDTIPDDLQYVVNSLSTSSVFTATEDLTNLPEINITLDQINAGETVTVTYAVTVLQSVMPGEVLDNTATATWTSLAGDFTTDTNPYVGNATERTGDTTDPGGNANDYTNEDTATFTVDEVIPTKELVATSETNTAGSNVAIGEIVRYRLGMSIPESTSPNFQIVEQLPDGLQYLNDGSTMVALVSDDDGVTNMTSTVLPSGAQVIGDSSSITPTFVLPSAQISVAGGGSGDDVTFSLGDIVNFDQDADEEFIVIEFNAIVNNQLSNQDGTVLSNTYFTRIDGTDHPASVPLDVTVQESQIAFDKVVSQQPDDAGDTIEYTITATGQGLISSFDVNIFDTLPSDLTLVSVNPSGATLTDNSNIAGNAVSITIPELAPSDVVTVVVTATVNNNVLSGQEITNQANLTYESLSGESFVANPTGSVVTGADGSSLGLRNADDGDLDSGVVNDYNIPDQVTIALNTPTIDKITPADTDYAIGEEVVYPLVVELPEGDVNGLIVRDQLPAGLIYVSEQIVTTAAASNGLLTADYNGDALNPAITGGTTSGEDVDYTFGTVTTTDDNVANNNSFVIFVTARVENIIGNQNGTNLVNTGEIIWTDPNTNAQTSATDDADPITVIEPELQITKVVDNDTPTFDTELEYTINISHTNPSTADAQDVVVTDIIPAGLTYVTGSLQGPLGWTVDDTNAPTLTLSGDLALASTASFTYRVETGLPADLTVGQDITNTASMVWTSISGTNTNERDGTDGVGGLNNYTATQDETVTISAYDLTVTKDDGVTSATNDDVLIYDLTIENIGNAGVVNVVVTETVPNFTTFNAAQSTSGWSCVDGDIAGTICTFDITSLAGSASQDIDFAVTVDSTLPNGAENITNDVSVAGDPVSGLDANPNNNSDQDVDTLNATPDISVTIDDGQLAVIPGQGLTYTVTVSNIGNQDATGVVTTTTLPNNTTIDQINDGGGLNLGTIEWPPFNLDAGDSVTFTFTVAVDDSIPASITQIESIANANDDGTNGADPTPANNTDNDVDTLDAAPDLTVIKTPNQTVLTPTDDVIYTIEYENAGNQTAENVVLSEVVPSQTTFDAANSDAGWSCSDNDPAGTICTLSVGTLDPTDTGSVDFAVTLDATLEAGIESIDNTVSIADDGTNGIDPTPGNNQYTEQTPVTATPDITITKDNAVTVVTPGQNISYTLTISNVGDQNATDVAIIDTLPANTTYSSSSDGGVLNGSQVEWPLIDLDAGVSVTRTLTITTDTSYAAGIDEVVNSAAANDDGTNGTDPTPANNQAQHTDTLDAAPDLMVTKTDGGASLVAGDVIEYTIEYDNIGNQDATGVVISETVPANSTFDTAQSTLGWSCNDGDPAGTNCTFTIGNLSVNATATITFAVEADTPLPAGVDELNNTVTIADDGANGTDPDLSNNTDDEDTTLTGEPDLTITIDDGGISTEPGENVVYTIDYENTGNQDATGVVITQVVPTGSTFDATNSDPGWSCVDGDPAGTICTFTVGDLDSGENGTIDFAVDVDSPLGAGIDQLDLTVNITDDGSNTPAPVTDSDPDFTPINAAPDLSITKDDGVTEITAGDVITYTFTIENIGSQDATNVEVVDILPAELTYQSSSDSGTLNVSQVEWPLFDLAVNASVTRTVTVTTSYTQPIPAGVQDITNTATVTDDGTNGADLDLTNNQDTDVDTTTEGIDLVVTKSDAVASVAPNEVVIYTIVVENVADQIASDVVVTETVPTGTTFNPAGSTAGWVCSNGGIAGDTCTFSIPSLGSADGQTSIDFAVLTDLTLAQSEINNVVQVTDDGTSGPDETPADNTSNEVTPVVGLPDLEIIKSNGVDEVIAGSISTYTLTVTNIGDTLATGVEVVDTLSPYMIFQSADNGGTFDVVSGTVTWSGITLNPGESTDLELIVDISAAIPAGVEQATNTASVTDDGVHGTDPDTSNNTGEDTDDLIAQPELTIEQTANPVPYPDQDMTYVYEYGNIGTQDVTGVVLTVTVPDFTFVSQESLDAGWVCTDIVAGSTCTFNVGDMSVGDTGQTPFTVTVVSNDQLDPNNTVITNEVEIADDGNNGSEVTLVNNFDLAQGTIAFADLEVIKTVQSQTAQRGDTLIYEFAFTNYGLSDATDVVMTDTLPVELRFISANRSGVPVNVTQNGQTLTIQVGNLAAGASGIILIETEVIENTDALITNQVSIFGNEADPVISNNFSQAQVQLETLPIPDLLRTGGTPAYIAIFAGLILLVLSAVKSFKPSEE